jgi:hypothetical protein
VPEAAAPEGPPPEEPALDEPPPEEPEAGRARPPMAATSLADTALILTFRPNWPDSTRCRSASQPLLVKPLTSPSRANWMVRTLFSRENTDALLSSIQATRRSRLIASRMACQFWLTASALAPPPVAGAAGALADVGGAGEDGAAGAGEDGVAAAGSGATAPAPGQPAGLSVLSALPDTAGAVRATGAMGAGAEGATGAAGASASVGADARVGVTAGAGAGAASERAGAAGASEAPPRSSRSSRGSNHIS